MKKQIEIKLLVVVLLLAVAQLSRAQGETFADVNFSIPPIALIDIEPDINNSIQFMVDPNTESGRAPVISESQNQTLWLNYTSAQSSGQNKRSVSAAISSGTTIEGVSIYVEASSYRGTGSGSLGIPQSKKILSTFPQTIVTNISNCYTGDGVGNGHLLTFNIEITDYTKLYSTTGANFIITYTLTDN